MAHIWYDKLWRIEFYIRISAKDTVQDRNLNHLFFGVNDTYKKDEKTKTNFETSNDEVVVSKGYLDTNLSEVNGFIS